jgi:hypothetical protein
MLYNVAQQLPCLVSQPLSKHTIAAGPGIGSLHSSCTQRERGTLIGFRYDDTSILGCCLTHSIQRLPIQNNFLCLIRPRSSCDFRRFRYCTCITCSYSVCKKKKKSIVLSSSFKPSPSPSSSIPPCSTSHERVGDIRRPKGHRYPMVYDVHTCHALSSVFTPIPY